jgi:TPR repeat protein
MWQTSGLVIGFMLAAAASQSMAADIAAGSGLGRQAPSVIAVAAKTKPKPAPTAVTPPIDAAAKAEFDALLAKAAAGDTAAMQSLVYNYRQGYGVAKDLAAADLWERRRIDALTQAAERGNPDAMSDLAALYDVGGDGVAADAGKALLWHERHREALLARARTGDADSMLALADILERATVGLNDYAGSVVWLRKAADAGNFAAMTRLADKYDDGTDVPADRAEAFRWYARASKDPKDPWAARIALANKYKTGDGVDKNVGEAARLHVLIAESYGGWRRRMRAESFAGDVARAEVGYRRAVQQELAERGLFKGAIDGQPSANLDAAVKAVWRRKADE